MATYIDAFKILAVAFFAHAYIGAINEYWHIEEDKKHPQYKYKPLVRGDITKKNAKIYILFCLIAAIVCGPELSALAILTACAIQASKLGN